MACYPISHNGGKSLGDYFEEILTFHVPPSKEVGVLDPTCGKHHLWVNYLQPNLWGKTKLEEYGEVFFSDIKDFSYSIVSSLEDLEFEEKFNAIVYDPPYFFGY